MICVDKNSCKIVMDMNTRSLETLLWIVRLGSVTAAARYLNLSQPAVTRRIRELEHDLRAKLFRREGRGVVLTPIGRTCAAIADRIVGDAAALRLAAGGDAGIAGTIRLGVSEVIALSWLHPLLARIEQRHPNVHLELDVDLSARLIRKLEARHIDVGLVPGPVSLPGAIRAPLGSSQLRWMARPGYIEKRTVEPADLCNVQIITLSRDANANAMMESWFQQVNIKPSRVNYCNSLSVIASLVRDGFGISLLPRELFSGCIGRGELAVLDGHPPVPEMEYWATYMPIVELPALALIAALAREESWFLQSANERWSQLHI
jgi:DNA-binding transcriptional LysR family regulator